MQAQAHRAWNAKFTRYVQVVGSEASLSDSILFVKMDGDDMIILSLYVDDIIIIDSNTKLVQYD